METEKVDVEPLWVWALTFLFKFIGGAIGIVIAIVAACAALTFAAMFIGCMFIPFCDPRMMFGG